MTAVTQKHILIIEDDKYILASLAELLNEEGYQVSTAANGQEGIDFLRQATVLPNLILLDLMMPIKDGIAFRHEQEADARLMTVPVVLMSADAHLEVKKANIGLKLHIKKPLDLDHLLETVKSNCT